jgi:hypothetical protein
MITASIYVLNVPTGRRGTLLAAATEGDRFGPPRLAEPVKRFAHSSRAPLIVLASFANRKITHIANGRKGASSGTGLVRLNMTDLRPLERPLTFKRLIEQLPRKLRHHFERVMAEGGLLPPKTRTAVVKSILEHDPTLGPLLDRFSQERERWIAALSDRSKENLAIQKETLITALEIAGIETTEVLEWEPTETAPTSFLDALGPARVREDAMLLTDFSNLPGFEALKDAKHVASRTFVNQQDPSVSVTVVMANRLALEEQTGADLIYYNETYRSFILVQYKAMEKGNDGAEFRWADDDQFMEEIGRMDRTLAELDKIPADDHPDGFRFHRNPFFLKFCPRIVFNPDDKGLFKGIYLPLALWKALVSGSHLKGPKGGNVLTYENVRRRLTNDEFVALVASAWVGTTISQSEALEDFIRDVLKGGKSLTFAVKHEVPSDQDVVEEEDLLDGQIARAVEIDEEGVR